MTELAFQPQPMTIKRRRDDDSDSEDDRWLKVRSELLLPSRSRDANKARSWGLQPSFGSAGFPTSSILPLRSTPSPPYAVPGLESMTSAQSEHSDVNSPASIDQDPLICSPTHQDVDYAMQMDEDDLDMVASQPPDTPFMTTNFRPAKLNPDLFGRESPANSQNSSTGRLPTPIYPTFANSGAMNGLGYPSSGMAGGMNSSNGYLGIPTPLNPPLMQPPPRKMGAQYAAAEQDRSRRMPSPISEDEDIPDTPTAFAQSQMSRLSVTSSACAPDHMMDTDSSRAYPPTSPSIRGRKRSGALTGSGRFSMGYREDCERCRLRVPGHYSHFLP
ncbi:unnamed protein product [Periconia digitata]|uniref:Uncharacterized protein n=1 Tax=Periconia digitata TaxID=1303443 RepID=A0A9W4UR01_9PLEO|nr:unnamed protein product [Periconia digitata]